jgi:hypothetical protein
MGQYRRYVDYYARSYGKRFPAAQVMSELYPMSREDYDKLMAVLDHLRKVGVGCWLSGGRTFVTPEVMVEVLAEFDNEECAELAEDIKEYHAV